MPDVTGTRLETLTTGFLSPDPGRPEHSPKTVREGVENVAQMVECVSRLGSIPRTKGLKLSVVVDICNSNPLEVYPQVCGEFKTLGYARMQN